MVKSVRRGVRAREGPLYAAVTVGWLVLTLLACGMAIHGDWEEVQAGFERHADHELAVLRERLRANDGVLDGLAGLLVSVDELHGPPLQSFANQIVRTHPQIHMVEVVERVPAEARRAFEAELARRTGGDGRLARFDYAAGRSWGPVAQKAEYFPISFIWPDLPQARTVIGLDLDSVPHLRGPLRDSIESGLTEVSPPFELVEGPRAYVMLKPARRESGRASRDEVPTRFALQVIKLSALRPEVINAGTDQAAYFVGRAAHARTPIYELPAAQQASGLERMLLPERAIEQMDFGSSQPFALNMKRQMRAADVSLDVLAAVVILAALLLGVLMMFLRRYCSRAAGGRESA